MHSESRSILAGVTLIAVAWGSAACAATISIHPNEDNSIYSESDNSNALGGLFAGETSGGNLRRALLAFDISGSGIPAGSIINSVSLALTQTKIGPAASATFELHPLSAAWGEGTSHGTGSGDIPTTGDATWNYRLYATSLWTAPGGDFGPTSGTAAIGTANGVYAFNSQAGMVADVQSWLKSPGVNFGWILRAADESPGVITAREFGSRESSLAQQPTLTVTFSAALAGDANLDGIVDISDLSKVLTNYDKSGKTWGDGDFNGNGTVEIQDLANVLTNYDKTSGLGTAGIKAAPEPSALALLGAGTVALMGYRWRRILAPGRIGIAACLVALLLGSAANGAQDVLPSIPKGTIPLNLQAVATGLGAPDYAVSPPGDPSRLFILEQKGTVLVRQNGSLLPAPALDIQSLISTAMNPANANDERGLLGLAFHPGFNDPSSPGYHTLYTYNSEPLGAGVTYAAPNGAVQNYKNAINEWKLSSTNPNVIDPSSQREVISFGKNASNHNGGTIAFGSDGYLYLGTGDGGNANDVGPSHIEPGGNAQNLTTPLGKMLRIDPLSPTLKPSSTDPVSSNGQYRIPVTNPFQAPGQVPEIYAYGLRNPYRFSFDAANGQLIAADVGQNTVEEIDRINLGGNYGWAVKEGDFLFNRTTGPNGAAGTVGARSPGSPAGLIDPISGPAGTLEYDHGDGISITGGFVYRGTAIPELYGKYVFGDLALIGTPVRANGRLFYADLTTGAINEFLLPQFSNGVLPNGLTVHGFGQDANGELYALVTNTPSNGTGGMMYAITRALPGDANLDGIVDVNDLSKIFINYDQTGTNWAQGDFNNDGQVDINDLNKVLTNYGATAGFGAAGIKSVPEPAGLGLLGFAAIALLGYAWRRRRW